MRIVITGGTGMLGSKLVDQLVAKGYQLVVLTRSPQKHPDTPNVDYQKWDAKTAVGWGETVDSAHAVINLAGESIGGEGFPPDRWTDEKKKRILQSRLNAGNAVMEAISNAKEKPKVLLQMAAIGYYGNRGAETLTEESTAGSDFLAGVVQQWEASTATAEEMGIRRVVMRTGIVYSTEGGALPSTLIPFKLFAGGPLGSGKQYVSWVHIDDVISAIIFLLEHEAASGPVNITAPNPLTNRQMAKEIGKVMKRPSFMPAPGFAIRLALGEVATLVLDGQKVMPAKLKELGYNFKYEYANEALTDLLK